MKSIKSLAAMLLLVVNGFALAQSAKMHVFLDSTAEDTQGARLVYAVKEQIRRSSSMQLSDTEKTSVFQLHLITMDPDQRNVQTIYSFAVTLANLSASGFFPLYIDSTVGSCGSSVIDQCANSIVARLDQNISAVRASFEATKK